MADAYLVKQGAAGSGSDECTANRKHVLAPYTAITGDSGDDPTTGTMLEKDLSSRRVCNGSGRISRWKGNRNGKRPCKPDRWNRGRLRHKKRQDSGC